MFKVYPLEFLNALVTSTLQFMGCVRLQNTTIRVLKHYLGFEDSLSSFKDIDLFAQEWIWSPVT